MAGVQGYTTSASTHIYYLAGSLAPAAEKPVWAEISGAGKLILPANRIADATLFGGGSPQANTIEFVPLGAESTIQVPGIPSIEDITLEVAYDHGKTVDAALKGLALNTKVILARVLRNSDAAQTAEVWNAAVASDAIVSESGAVTMLHMTFATQKRFPLVDQA